jgi:hypothetical protein
MTKTVLPEMLEKTLSFMPGFDLSTGAAGRLMVNPNGNGYGLRTGDCQVIDERARAARITSAF